MAAVICAMVRTFLSVNVVALRRRVISFRRGCVQLPGLSVAGAGADGRIGVNILDLKEDIVVVGVVVYFRGCCGI